MRRRALVRAGALAICLLAVGAVPAHADDGPASGGRPLGRPPFTILRPADVAELVRRLDAAWPGSPECIVALGGLGSKTDGSDTTFSTLLERYETDERFRIHRFGVKDPDFAYDTVGAISVNADHLVGKIRALAAECAAFHVVTHSIGGAVADRAFSKGLSAADGVVTYLPLAGPHNGAAAARVVRSIVEIDDGFAETLATVATRLGQPDPRSAAVRDLAAVKPPRPLRDVAALRLRIATDPLVLMRDHLDSRWESREYLPEGLEQLEGHDGILHDSRIRSIVQRAIDERRAPADDRSLPYRAATLEVSVAADATVSTAVAGAGQVLALAAIVYRVRETLRGRVRDLLDAFRPAETRREPR